MSSPLHLAWQERLGIEHGAGQLQAITTLAGKITQRGITSLMLACRLPNFAPSYQASNAVRALLAANADPAVASAESQLTALHVAAESLPPQIQPFPNDPIEYGAKKQHATQQSTAPPLG